MSCIASTPPTSPPNSPTLVSVRVSPPHTSSGPPPSYSILEPPADLSLPVSRLARHRDRRDLGTLFIGHKTPSPPPWFHLQSCAHTFFYRSPNVFASSSSQLLVGAPFSLTVAYRSSPTFLLQLFSAPPSLRHLHPAFSLPPRSSLLPWTLNRHPPQPVHRSTPLLLLPPCPSSQVSITTSPDSAGNANEHQCICASVHLCTGVAVPVAAQP